MYKLSTMIDKNVDNVIMIIFRQKYAPEHSQQLVYHYHYHPPAVI